MAEKQEFNTYLAKVSDSYMPMITRQLEDNNIVFSEYSKKCVLNAIASINQVLDAKGIKWDNPQLDKSNLTQTLLTIASLELNPAANPRECYFQLRNVKKEVIGQDGKPQTVWSKVVEFGIEGDGNDAILARFGRDVKKVYPYWLVRADDDFEYPQYVGISVTPPKWIPRGTGEVVRIVYPVLHTDNTIHYYIGERADVAKNLMAHINNNLMNETFGICKDRYKATAAELDKIAAKKAEIKKVAKELGLKAIEHPEVSKYISPSWKEEFSSETMIIRKMRNNIVKKIPKDFGSSFAKEFYTEATNDEYRVAKADIIEHTGSIEISPLGDYEAAEPLYGYGDEKPVQTTIDTLAGADEATAANIEDRQKPSFD